jgi:tRNA threonylcarbamoyladenosine biosynthesis protein TsaB
MRILALDSTTRAGSAALIVADSGVVGAVDERVGDASRTQAERLPSDLLALLAAHGTDAGGVDLFAVASGPGLFTGLRIGIATMQGFALVVGKPLIGVSALEAIGHLASRDVDPGVKIAAWMNAHRKDVFTALYDVDDRPRFDPDRLIAREDASVGDPAATLQRWLAADVAPDVIAGDGAELYRGVIVRHLRAAQAFDPGPLAAAIGLIALHRYQGGERGSAASVHPLYVRRPDAELAREHALADRSTHLDRSD